MIVTVSVAPSTATTFFAASTAKRTSKRQLRPCAVHAKGATKAPSSVVGPQNCESRSAPVVSD